MITVRNDKMIKRYRRIGTITMIVSLVVLVGSMIFTLRNQSSQLGFTISLVGLALGFILSQISFYLGNRFGRSPRPDELLSQALKGLGSQYRLYHYTTPVSHLLVGPAGVWILLPYHQRGKITYAHNRWHQKGGNWYLRIFAQDSIGRPEVDIAAETDRLKRFLFKHLKMDEATLPPIQTVLVFTNPKVQIEIAATETPPCETIYIKDLKETIRKAAKSKRGSQEKIVQIQDLFGGEGD